MIESVEIDGDAIALADVFAAVTLRHGRASVDDEPLGSTATLSLVNVDAAFTGPFRVGRELAIDVTGAVARFRGRITDAALNTDDPDEPTLSILAVSTLARISGRKVGAVDWPAEAWSDRVERAFTEAGALAELVLEIGTEDPALAARPAEEASLADVLQELAETVSAAIADRPDGKVLVQAVTSRQGAEPIELDPELVVLAPEWAQSDDVANVVRVEWSGGTVELQDASSIALYDERAPLTISTLLSSVDAANARAALELNRRSRPDWRIDSAELLELDLDLAIGSPVMLTELPAASPRPLHIGMLEGWTDHVEAVGGELEWTMTLSLSPQRLSGYGLAWEDVPSAIAWEDVDPSITWDEPEQMLA